MTQPGEGTQSGAPGAQSGAPNDGSTTPPGTTSTTDPNAQSGAPAEKTYTQADLDAMRNQLSAADRKREEAERKAKALEDAALSEEEKRKRDLEQANKDLAAKDEEIKKLRIRNAFVTDNTYDWHNPEAALQLANLGNVVIDGEKVTGLKEAVEAVAKAHPYMIKPKDAAGTTPPPAGVTGVAGQGAGGAGSDATSKANLERRFPAMRGRVS
jgi:hypothetical protein